VLYPTDDLLRSLTVADLNKDGNLDLIASANKVDVFLGKGDGTFPNRVDYAVTGSRGTSRPAISMAMESWTLR
jgi:hypothetical protein